MSVKSTAALTAQNSAVVTAVSSPDGITPASLGAHLQDIIDSGYNEVDDPAPSNSDGVVVQSMSVPDAFDGIVDNGDSLTQWLQAMANLISQISETMPVQGNAGCFLATVDSNTQQTFRCHQTLGDSAYLILTNDSSNGGFDNGNNWSSAKYTAPAANFTGRFLLSNVEVEVVSIAAAAGSSTLTFQLVLNGSNYGSAVLVTINNTTAAATDKIILETLMHPIMANAADVFNAGDKVAIKVTGFSSSTGDIIVRVNKGLFSNIDI